MNEKLKNLKFNELAMTVSKAVLKTALLAEAAQSARKPSLRVIILPVAGLLTMAAAGMYLAVETNDRPGPVNNLGGIWCTYDDRHQGGNSTVWPPASTSTENNFVKSAPGFAGKGYAVRVTGTAGMAPDRNYLGINTFLSPLAPYSERAGISLTRFKGIRFKIKGDLKAGQLLFILPCGAPSAEEARTFAAYADYQADITPLITAQWREVEINFRRDLKQPPRAAAGRRADIEKVLSDAHLVKWHYCGGRGQAVDLWIDDLELY